MTPHDKASALVHGFYNLNAKFEIEHETCITWPAAKIIAGMVAEEIMQARPIEPVAGGYYETISDRAEEAEQYWIEVIKEIEKL